MRSNNVKAKLEKGETVVGSFLHVPSPRLAELIGMVGFDFVVIDQEHGPISPESAEGMVRACELVDCTPLARVSSPQPHYVLQVLDLGAMGVHIPGISTAQAARHSVTMCKYAPLGRRGLAAVRAAGYGLDGPLSNYCQMANDEVLVIIHIEEVEAIENLDELLAVEGVDVYYIGPTDLSNSLGCPGRMDENVQELVDIAIRKIVSANKVAGVITADLVAAQRYIDMGVRYLATHAVQLMAMASKSFLRELKR